jgi:hypothetical protein
MLKRGFALEFNLPEGWSDDSGGSQVVAHGPLGEELIVSGSVITGPGPVQRASSVRGAVLENAFESVLEAVDVPELSVVKALGPEEGPSGLECWTLEAQTTNNEVAFLQGIVASDISVAIVTMEGSNGESTRRAFRSFLEGIRTAPTQ